MTWMTREEATEAVARDILADPAWTARVVVSAVVAETQLSRALARHWPDADPVQALQVLTAALMRQPTPDREEPCRLHDIRRCTICNAPAVTP